MKISAIHIKNYRSCRDTEFKPNSQLSALIGVNGSGKTTILSAIRLLSALLRPPEKWRTMEDKYASECELKMTYSWNGKKIIHSAKIYIITNERNEDEVIDSEHEWYMFDVTKSKKRFHVPLSLVVEYAKESNRQNHRVNESFFADYYFGRRKGGDKAYEAIKEVAKFIRGFNYYGASQFVNPSLSPTSFEVESESGGVRRGISIGGHKKLLYDMYQMSRSGNCAYREFLKIIGTEGIGLIENLEFGEIQTSSSKYNVMTGGSVRKIEKSNLLIIPRFKFLGNELSPNQLSEGTFKTIALVFYLVTDNSSLLLLEEPEVCIHHGLLNSVMELIKIFSAEKQIIVSTHSESVLDKLKIQNVYVVKRDPAHGTMVKGVENNMKAIELAALKRYLQSEGGLGEYWRHGDLENV